MTRNFLAVITLVVATSYTERSIAASQLEAYNVDIRQTSVSGFSSGAFMAVQFDVAFSSILKGAGIISGGPYYCMQGSVRTRGPCSPVSGTNDVGALVRVTDLYSRAGKIDPTSNLANHRVFLFSSTADSVVRHAAMNDVHAYYRHYINDANIHHKKDLYVEHVMPTDSYGAPCNIMHEPFIGNCHYDAAGEILKWIYGRLNSRNPGLLSGVFIEFDQSEFIHNPVSHSIDETGWLYVPANCAHRQSCKLHVVFHGCSQYASYTYFNFTKFSFATFGTTFIKNAGYNAWADSNNIIVLYPQATSQFPMRNPNGCWDFWGYDDPDYATKTGRQMAAVKRMIDRIASGFTGPVVRPSLGGTAEAKSRESTKK